MGHKFLRFALVGLVAVGLNLVLFGLLVGRLGIQYLWATVVVFALVNGYGFLANRRWVFRVADRPARRMARYYATMAASLGLNLVSMALLVDGLKLNYLLASVITSAWLAPVLYLTHDRVAFARRAPRRTRPLLLLVTHYYAEHGGGVEIVAGQLAGLLSDKFDIEWRADGAKASGEAASEAGRVDTAFVATAGGGAGGPTRRPIRCWNGIERQFGLPVPIPFPTAVVAVVRAARAADFVWVHDLIYPSTLLASLAAISARKPLLVTVHVGLIPYRNPLIRRTMAVVLGMAGRWVLTKAAVVVFVSERVQAECLARWRLRDQLLIPNGVDFLTFKPPAELDRRRVRAEVGSRDRALVLFVGRFVERKGLPILHELAQRMPSVDWVFAGGGPSDPGAWSLPNVHVERNRSGQSLAELYGAADMLALPSVGEGFPLVVGEALACGLPVLVDPSTIAGYKAAAEVASSELASGADVGARWEKRIVDILSHESGRADLASRRVEFARRHWNWDRAAAEYARVFAEAARGD